MDIVLKVLIKKHYRDYLLKARNYDNISLPELEGVL